MTGTTDDPNDPRLKRGVDAKPGPQHDVYLVLSEEERAKGYVRPVRYSYVHVGEKLCGKADTSGVHGEIFCVNAPGHEGPCSVFADAASLAQRRKGCGVTTTMRAVLCETYARDPKFYGSTYCTGCRMHLPVAQFVWEVDGKVVGS